MKLKNTLKGKKYDADGNELAEQIGKGLNIEHINKVKKARLCDSVITFKIPELEKALFMENENPSELLRNFVQQMNKLNRKLF